MFLVRNCLLLLASLAVGWFAGRFGGPLVWDYMYGAAMVSDEIYYRLHDSIPMRGGKVGALIGPVTFILLLCIIYFTDRAKRKKK
jgi:hypothetical protein